MKVEKKYEGRISQLKQMCSNIIINNDVKDVIIYNHVGVVALVGSSEDQQFEGFGIGSTILLRYYY